MEKGKMLLIDDNENDLNITRELLKKVGYRVIENHGWYGVNKRIRRYIPDMVLFDVNLPGLSGDSLFKIFKDEVSTLKVQVLYYSSLDNIHLNNLILQENLTDFVEKGDIFQLYRKIASYLRKKVT
ncbi:MAG: response regulator [Thermodesulfovibrio sp.]|nr:response regulator [Thermodesulfovibrio sp.]